MIKNIAIVMMIDEFMMSDLEKMVALDMIELGYDFQDKADINEFWMEQFRQWTE